MAKTQEELIQPKFEYETLNKKTKELNDGEFKLAKPVASIIKNSMNMFFNICC